MGLIPENIVQRYQDFRDPWDQLNDWLNDESGIGEPQHAGALQTALERTAANNPVMAAIGTLFTTNFWDIGKKWGRNLQ